MNIYKSFIYSSILFIGFSGGAVLAEPVDCSSGFCEVSNDTARIQGTIRDFITSDSGNVLAHPDFEQGIQVSDLGIVESELGSDNKPVYADPPDSPVTPTTNGADNFNLWFNDNPTYNESRTFDFFATKINSNGVLTFSANPFLPIDDSLLGNEDRQHNYHFTFETHSTFRYEGGETLSYVSDDDLWVFINGVLAVDLGGIHQSDGKTIDLNELAGTLEITRGNVYSFDLFFAERQTSDSVLRFDIPQLSTAIGDVNGDNCIDRNDLNEFIAVVRSKSNDLKFDLNNDGVVNIADARKLVTLFTNPRGTSCTVKATWNSNAQNIGDWTDNNWIFDPLLPRVIFPNNDTNLFNVFIGTDSGSGFGSEVTLNSTISINDLSITSDSSSLKIPLNKTLTANSANSTGSIDIKGVSATLQILEDFDSRGGTLNISLGGIFKANTLFNNGVINVSGGKSLFQIGSYTGSADMASLSVVNGAEATTERDFDAGHGNGTVKVDGAVLEDGSGSKLTVGMDYKHESDQSTLVENEGLLHIRGSYDQIGANTTVSNGGVIRVDGVYRLKSTDDGGGNNFFGSKTKVLTDSNLTVATLEIDPYSELIIDGGGVQVGDDLDNTNPPLERLSVGINGFLTASGQESIGNEIFASIVGDVEANGGTIDPGSANFRGMKIDGNFVLNSGTLIFEIAGLNSRDSLEPGEFDFVKTTGSANLEGGEVRFVFSEGFLPQAGDEVEFLTSSSGVVFVDETDVGTKFITKGLASGFQCSIYFSGNKLTFVARKTATSGNADDQVECDFVSLAVGVE